MRVSNPFHDDITWCADNCPIQGCFRNPVNMSDRDALHSFAYFKGTDDCPVYKSTDGCMDKCIHAAHCFAEYKDPNNAIRALIDGYCDNCYFAEVSED